MNVVEPRLRAVPRNQLEERIAALGPWFHNINLGGVWTAPNHFLGDYPGAKFRRFAPQLPRDLSGRSVLDIGCNAGFYSIEMKRRGAGRVLGIDSDERYLAQARLASETLGFDDIEFAQADVYDVGAIGEKFDLVIFMGVLYHLRHPLLALDLIREHVAGDMLLFQSMQRGSKHVLDLDDDYEFGDQHLLRKQLPQTAFHRAAIFAGLDQLVGAQPRLHRGDAAFGRVHDRAADRGRSLSLPDRRTAVREIRAGCRLSGAGGRSMIEAAMIWNEPNNKSHWDPEIDPEWTMFADMAIQSADAIRQANPDVKRVLGGMSPIDPFWVERMKGYGVIDAIDVVALHGFPLDWNLWPIDEWPQRVADIEAVIPGKELWVTEVGVGSFGAEEVQQFGINRTAELLLGRVPRVFWYSLFDLPRTWEATTRHKEAEGSSYYRHFYMGLIKEDGTPKLALDDFRKYTPEMGIMQWFHWHDHRLDDAVRWLQDLGVTHLRTGLSWWDSYRDGWEDWFDRQMDALEPFNTTVTFCFTPDHLGIQPHHTSPPRDPAMFADFCGRMIERYAPSSAMKVAAE